MMMDLADLMQNYFGTRDLAAIEPHATRAGVERMRVDFGLEKDRGRRFALWTLLHIFDAAPDLDVAFEHEEDRDAARNLMDLMAQANETPDG